MSVQVYYGLVEVEGWAGVRSWALKTDHWFYGLFQSAPDLIALLLPQGASAAPSLGPDSPGDALYRFAAPELKAANHRLDGAFWPQTGEAGTPEQPVVLLEVQMHSKPGFKHRLGAQSFVFSNSTPRCCTWPSSSWCRTGASTSAQPSYRSSCRPSLMAWSG